MADERVTYLGDGVYAEWDSAIPRTLVLYTSDGIVSISRIYLEPEVLAALLQFLGVSSREK